MLICRHREAPLGGHSPACSFRPLWTGCVNLSGIQHCFWAVSQTPWDVSLYQSSYPCSLAVSRLFILILPRYYTYLDTHFLRAPSVLFLLPASLQKASSWTAICWSCCSDLPSTECLQKSHADEKRTRLSTDFTRQPTSWKRDFWGQSPVCQIFFLVSVLQDKFIMIFCILEAFQIL